MAAYTPTVWVNNQSPPLSAANLDKLTDELEAQASETGVIHSLPDWTDNAAPALTDAAPLNEIERVLAAVAVTQGLSYTVTVWENGWTPARNAARFNRMEQQAAANRTAIDSDPTTAGIGVAFLRYGGAGVDVHASDYDLRVLSQGSNASAVYSPTLLYKSFVHLAPVASGVNYGVSLEDARANNWVLLDSGGTELVTVGTYKLANVGSAGYRAAWCANVEANIAAWGYEGFMNDDCTGDAHYGPGNSAIPLYPTAAAWQTAMLGMADTVYSYFNSRGRIACHNAGWFVPGDPGTNDASRKKDWWSMMAPYSDYLMDENWMVADAGATSPDADDLRRVGSEWYNNWDNYQGLVDYAYSIGVKPFCLSKGRTTPNPTRRLTYCFASFMLDWEPAVGGVFGWCATEYVGTGQWPTQYDAWLPLGAPTGAKTKVGNEWRRTFANHEVRVDPVAGTASVI